MLWGEDWGGGGVRVTIVLGFRVRGLGLGLGLGLGWMMIEGARALLLYIMIDR